MLKEGGGYSSVSVVDTLPSPSLMPVVLPLDPSCSHGHVQYIPGGSPWVPLIPRLCLPQSVSPSRSSPVLSIYCFNHVFSLPSPGKGAHVLSPMLPSVGFAVTVLLTPLAWSHTRWAPKWQWPTAGTVGGAPDVFLETTLSGGSECVFTLRVQKAVRAMRLQCASCGRMVECR